MAELLVAREITVVRDERRIVDRASVALRPGTIVTVQGASGSGKSTLLRAIATLIPIASGTLAYEGRTPRELGVVAYRRHVAYVPQLPRMFEGTVAENVRAGPAYRGEAIADARVAEHLAKVGLAPAIAARPASDLSGGERLRVALARALANDPRVVLVDEPTSALDPDAALVVLELLSSLAQSGTAVLVVTHSERDAAHLDGTRFHMEDGVLSGAEGRNA